MQKEMVDILDSKGKLTGVVKPKDEAHSSKLWHRSVHVWIYNSKGEVLIQKRAAMKKSGPGKWDISAAGHVSSGEKTKESALRELEEEIGIKADPRNLKHVITTKRSMDIKDIKFYEREFCYVYLLKHEKLPTKLQREEVAAVKFIPIEKFSDDIKSKKTKAKYVQHPKSYYLSIIRLIKKELKKRSKAANKNTNL